MTRDRGRTVWRALGVVVAAALALTGCGPGRLARAPDAAVDLSGHWVLDPATSDDAEKMIAAAVPKPHPRPEPAPVNLPPPSGEGGHGTHRSGQSQQASEPPPPAWGHVRVVDFVSAFVLPPRVLELEQQPGRVRIGTDAHRREFEAGDETPFSVTDRYGSRKVHAGWQHDEFVITSADGSRLHVVEHLRRRADERLERYVEFHAEGIKSLAVRSVYRRATPADLETAAGPPEPEKH